MPKTFPGSDQKQKHDRDIRKTVGVYDKPERTAVSRNMMIVALAVIVALLLLFVFYRLALSGQALSEAHAKERVSVEWSGYRAAMGMLTTTFPSKATGW